MTKRQGNRPDRRVIPAGSLQAQEIEALGKRVQYVGSALHKLHPGDYGFTPSHNPRPSKSACDDLRPVLRDEAIRLFKSGLDLGMVSQFDPGGVPKYIWAVGEDGQVYEAKTKPDTEIAYHGYRLGDDEREMRRYILTEWRQRWQRV